VNGELLTGCLFAVSATIAVISSMNEPSIGICLLVSIAFGIIGGTISVILDRS